MDSSQSSTCHAAVFRVHWGACSKKYLFGVAREMPWEKGGRGLRPGRCFSVDIFIARVGGWQVALASDQVWSGSADSDWSGGF